MARYRIAKDGHRYLTHGYPILDSRGQDDVHFAVYQVGPGAEHVFDRAGFEDGDRVLEETFFALLLDGDLYNDARPTGIKITSVPNRVLASLDYEVQKHHLDQFTIEGEVYLADILEKIRPRLKDAFDALSTASWLCIFRYWKPQTKKTTILALEIGQITSDYPHGYGFCKCGCKTLTKLNSEGVWVAYIEGHDVSRVEDGKWRL